MDDQKPPEVSKVPPELQEIFDLHQLLMEELHRFDQHHAEQLDAMLEDINALRSSVERRELRLDELSARITAVETQSARPKHKA
jgi:hypothetical protein